jgi:predicted DsbA family dithiol-disulfide isomerase
LRPRVIVFADYVCPFCYLAEQVLERLGRDHAADILGAAFELRPPGTPLPGPDAAWMRSAWTRQVEPLAAELDVTMRYPAVVTRTRKAHEAAAHARAAGPGAEMRAAIYRAYWQDARDIGRIDVLVEIGAELGLDATALRIALDLDQWTDHIVREEQAAARLGVGAVPAYVMTTASVEPTGLTAGAAVRTGLLRDDELRAWVETQV